MTVIMRISHAERGERHGSGPAIRRDAMDDIVSMGDGQVYNSKSAYYQALKRQRLEIDDRPRVRDDNRPGLDTSDLKADIAKAMKETLSPERAKALEAENSAPI